MQVSHSTSSPRTVAPGLLFPVIHRHPSPSPSQPEGAAQGAGACPHERNPLLATRDGAPPPPPLLPLLVAQTQDRMETNMFFKFLTLRPLANTGSNVLFLPLIPPESLPRTSVTCHVYRDWFHKTLFKCAFL